MTDIKASERSRAAILARHRAHLAHAAAVASGQPVDGEVDRSGDSPGGLYRAMNVLPGRDVRRGAPRPEAGVYRAVRES